MGGSCKKEENTLAESIYPPNLECCLGFLHFHVGILEGKGMRAKEPKVRVVMVEEMQVLNKSIR